MRIVPFVSFAIAIAIAIATSAGAQTRTFSVAVPTTADTAAPAPRANTAKPIAPLTSIEIAAAYKEASIKTKIPATPDAAASFDLGITNWQSGQRRLSLWFPRVIAAEWAVLLKAQTTTFENEPHVSLTFPVAAGALVMIDYEVYESDNAGPNGMIPSNGKPFTFRVMAPGATVKGDAISSQGHVLVAFATTGAGNAWAQILSKEAWAFRSLHVTANK